MTDEEILNCFEKDDWNTPCRFILDQSDWPTVIKADVNSRGGTDYDAKIVADEAALKFCQNLKKKSYRQEAALKGYYRGIGRNLWKHELRRRERYGFHLKEYQQLASTYRAEELFPEHWKEEYEHVTTVMAQLNVTNQRVLKLVGEKWSYKRIARKIGLSSQASVATTVKKARRKLIAAINRSAKIIITLIVPTWL